MKVSDIESVAVMAKLKGGGVHQILIDKSNYNILLHYILVIEGEITMIEQPILGIDIIEKD